MIKELAARLLHWKQHQNFKAAVRKANYLQNKNFKKHLVFLWDGKFVVIDRPTLKERHLKGHFKKGLNVRQLESLALYTTTL